MSWCSMRGVTSSRQLVSSMREWLFEAHEMSTSETIGLTLLMVYSLVFIGFIIDTAYRRHFPLKLPKHRSWRWYHRRW